MGSARPDLLTLREVKDDDLPILFEHQCDPEAVAMAAFLPRDWKAFVAHWRSKVLGDPTAIVRAVLFGGRLVGHVVSWNHEGRRLVGYWLDRAHWGKGIATAALQEFLQLDRVRPLQAYVAAHNLASMKVLARCGFVRMEESTAADGVLEYLYRLS